MKQMRLDKFLSETGRASRSEAKQLIKKGKVLVDGAVARKPELKVDPEQSEIIVDGVICRYQQFVYLMLHKPQGVVSATTDDRDRTVIDLLKEDYKDIFPVGRLDKDTEGLLLLTNDGDLAHRLLSPKKHVDKCYYAQLDGPVGQEEKESFAQGLDIGEEKKTLPARLEICTVFDDSIPEDKREHGVLITICEGKFHQVKRMAHAVGREVLYLKRLSMGSLSLDKNLKAGEYRELTPEEMEALQK